MTGFAAGGFSDSFGQQTQFSSLGRVYGEQTISFAKISPTQNYGINAV
jgi:hypothetical protein